MSKLFQVFIGFAFFCFVIGLENPQRVSFDSYWFLSISSSLLISGSDNRGVYFDTQLNCVLIIALFSKFANYLNVLCGQNSRKRTSVVLSTSVSAESSVG